MINPCFRDEGPTSAPQTLCNDLANAIDVTVQALTQVRVRAYDLHGAKPNYPKAEKILNANAAPASSCAREVACCLSFYSTNNVPSRRGRVYVPQHWLSSGSSVESRPNSTTRAAVADLATVFKNLGGLDVDWIVFSEKTGESHSVTDWWVDDEWDAQRRRGLRATTRLKGTTGESGPFRTVPLTPQPSAPLELSSAPEG